MALVTFQSHVHISENFHFGSGLNSCRSQAISPLVWLTPDDFTRQRESYRRKRVNHVPAQSWSEISHLTLSRLTSAIFYSG